jgi:hypothetical protein
MNRCFALGGWDALMSCGNDDLLDFRHNIPYGIPETGMLDDAGMSKQRNAFQKVVNHLEMARNMLDLSISIVDIFEAIFDKDWITVLEKVGAYLIDKHLEPIKVAYATLDLLSAVVAWNSFEKNYGDKLIFKHKSFSQLKDISDDCREKCKKHLNYKD